MSVYVYTDVYVSVMMIQAEVPSMNDWIVRLQSKEGYSIFSNGHATLIPALSVRR